VDEMESWVLRGFYFVYQKLAGSDMKAMPLHCRSDQAECNPANDNLDVQDASLRKKHRTARLAGPVILLVGARIQQI